LASEGSNRDGGCVEKKGGGKGSATLMSQKGIRSGKGKKGKKEQGGRGAAKAWDKKVIDQKNSHKLSGKGKHPWDKTSAQDKKKKTKGEGGPAVHDHYRGQRPTMVLPKKAAMELQRGKKSP